MPTFQQTRREKESREPCDVILRMRAGVAKRFLCIMSLCDGEIHDCAVQRSHAPCARLKSLDVTQIYATVVESSYARAAELRTKIVSPAQSQARVTHLEKFNFSSILNDRADICVFTNVIELSLPEN